MGLGPFLTVSAVLLLTARFTDGSSDDTVALNMTVEENNPAGSVIFQFDLTPTGKCQGEKMQATFEGERSFTFYSELLAMDDEGFISVKRSLDYEQDQLFKFVLSIQSSCETEPQMPLYLVQLIVLDVNDNSPIITSVLQDRTGEVYENSPPGTLIATLNVTDADSGPNGEVQCTLTEYDNFELSKHESGSYSLLTSRTFDREESALESIFVSCKDKGQPPRSTAIRVDVVILDVNDNAPQIDYGETTVMKISEEVEPGMFLASFLAFDADSRLNAKTSCSVNDSAFRVEYSEKNGHGSIMTNRNFDFETQSVYYVVLTCRNTIEPFLFTSTLYTIIIKDEKDNPPPEVSIFSLKGSEEIAIKENSKLDSIVAVVKVHVTSNVTDNVKCNVSDNDFKLGDLGSGEDTLLFAIQTAKMLDFEAKTNYNLKVSCNEPNAKGPGFRNIIINVIDVNDNAPIITLFPAEQYIVMGNGTFRNIILGYLYVTDADTGVGGEIDCRTRHDKFYIEPVERSKGEFRVRGSRRLRMLPKGSHDIELLVVCLDGGDDYHEVTKALPIKIVL